MSDTSTFFPCCISLCDPDSSTNLDYVLNSGLLNGVPDKFIVEFGSENSTILAVPGQRISVDQTIGYMRGLPVNSKISGTVTDVTDRYFIGEYDNTADGVLKDLGLSDFSDKKIQNILTSSNDSRFDKINDTLKESSYVNNFIKDYILRFRCADIANNYIQHNSVGVSLAYNNTSRICEIYNKSADDIIDEYNDEMEKICQASNVQGYCEKDNLMGLKKLMDDTKTTYFDKILWQYNNVASFGYNSGRISDLMLYDEYMSYITSDDFVYDENNPYVVELFYHITTFLQIRSRLELNSSNISELISKFNTLCNDNIRKYWDDKLYDYYGRIRQIFFYDFYADNDKEFIQASIYDKDRVTLYSKVLKYLETLCHYTPPMSAEEKYKDMDVNSIINNVQVQDDSDSDMEKLHDKLKKIAIFFVQLRKIESDIDPKYFEQFASIDDYNDIFTLKEQLEDQSLKSYILSHSDTSNIPHNESYDAFELKYLDPFKKMVQSEARILRDLSDRAIKFYLEMDPKINSGEIFDQFQEAEWSGKSTIYKDKEPHDFFYISEPTTTSEKMNSSYANSLTDENGYEFGEYTSRTKFGITDYEYWIKYCCVATIVNCMLPMYWSTGMIISGKTVRLPIVYIPFAVIKGRVTVVIGLGVCGICPLPMILFANLGDIPGSLIPTLNIAVDTIKNMVSMIPSLSVKPIKSSISRMIEDEDKKITELMRKKDEIKMNIQNLQFGVETDKETLRNLKRKRNDNPTTNTKKKQSSE